MKILPTVSQGVPATKAFFSVTDASRLRRTQAVDGTGSSGPNPAITGGGAQALPTEIDMQAFFAAWGTDSEQFDVTKDGTVDAKDLAVFLGAAGEKKTATPQEVIDSWGQPSGAGDLNGDGTVDAVDLAMALGDVQGPAVSSSQSLVDGVQTAWGTDNPQFDLNGDSTVNGADLAIALGSVEAQGTPPPPSLVDGVQQAWGTDNPQFDLNGDGTVNGTDLGIALGGVQTPTATAMASEAQPQDAIDQAAKSAAHLTEAVFGTKDGDGNGSLTASELASGLPYIGGADTNADSAISRDELQARLTAEFGKAASAGVSMETVASKWADALLRSDTTAIRAKSAYSDASGSLVNRLYDRLASSGFDRTPPSNLNRLVQGLTQGLGMNDSQRASLMRGLANRYPQGLGLSAKA